MEVEANREPSPDTVEEEEQEAVTVTAEISSVYDRDDTETAEIIHVATTDILQQAATTILSQVNNNLITVPVSNNNNEDQKVKSVKGKTMCLCLVDQQNVNKTFSSTV